MASRNDALPALRLTALGEAALVCELAPPAGLRHQQSIWALGETAARWRGVREAVPGMNNLTLLFDPEVIESDALEQQVREAWLSLPETPVAGRRVDIPVRYGGEAGCDLPFVAEHAGLTAAEVVRLHSQAEYVVYFLGFMPGFAYLGGLPPGLATPRRSRPRLAVPAGSVGIGGMQTGIYPLASPGGWQLIGRTSLTLFDPHHTQPTLLRPGDRVRFVIESFDS